MIEHMHIKFGLQTHEYWEGMSHPMWCVHESLLIAKQTLVDRSVCVDRVLNMLHSNLYTCSGAGDEYTCGVVNTVVTS